MYLRFPINRPHLYQAVRGAPNFFSASGVIFGQGRDLVNMARGTRLDFWVCTSKDWKKKNEKFLIFPANWPHLYQAVWGAPNFFSASGGLFGQGRDPVPRTMFTRSRPWPKITPLAEKKFGAPHMAWYKWGRFMGNIKYKLAFFSYPVFSTCLPKVD